MRFVSFNINFTSKEKIPSGVIFIILELDNKRLKELEVAVTNVEDAVLPDVNLRWKEFENSIHNFQREYLLNSQIILPLKKEIEERLSSPDGFAEVLNFLEKKQVEELSILFKYIIKEKIASDLDINLNVEFWEERVRDVKKEILQEFRERAIYLNIQIGCDNKSGKRIKDLKRGEKILVKIISSTPEEEYLSSLLKCKIGRDTFPIAAEAERIEEIDKDTSLFIVKFGPGILGRTIIKNDVKIITLGEDKIETLDSKTAILSPSTSKYFFADIILLLLLLGIYYFNKIIEIGY